MVPFFLTFQIDQSYINNSECVGWYRQVTAWFIYSGGLHHAAARVSGEHAYKFLKYEGGTHRVQRIPQVGLSSRMQRIHTGTTTVIVLPQPSKVMCAVLCLVLTVLGTE